MSTARIGRDREHKVAKHLILNHGWTLIMRAAASKGPGDLLLGHPDHGAALVQVGSKSKSLGPGERDRLCDAAELIGALALLAIVVPRQPIRYYNVTRDVPSRWSEWEAA